jgi:GMP synthase-like glutamine amidotransferase
MILIVKHIDIEGPGTLGDFLKEQGEPFTIVELGAGEPLPADPRAFKAVVVLGGPMNVDEENKYTFLKPENDFIQKVLKTHVPYLGICLGSQLLAKAAGARVVRSPVKEIGWYRVQLTAEGKKDPLFNGFSEQDPIYHWHGDMFEIPVNGRLLARAEGCPHQALKVGSNAYGIQFHVEVTDKSIREWCAEYCANDLPGRPEHAKAMMDDYWKYKKIFDAQAMVIYRNFLEITHAEKDPLLLARRKVC